MRKLSFIAITAICITSCIEKLEPVEPRFEKIYGYNSESTPWGLAVNSDGTYMIYGSATRTVLDMNNTGETREAEMPILIKIDQFGNDIMTRSFPISQVQYFYDEMVQYFEDLGVPDAIFNMDRAYFDSVV